MFWFRSALDMSELKRQGQDKDLYLFEIVNGPSCFIQNAAKLVCTPMGKNSLGQYVEYALDLSLLPDIQSWIHLTYSANDKSGAGDGTAKGSSSYMRVDSLGYSATLSGGYTPMGDKKIYYGTNAAVNKGFVGDLRELYVSYGYLSADKVPNLMHQAKVFLLNVMAYYRFESGNFKELKDTFRN